MSENSNPNHSSGKAPRSSSNGHGHGHGHGHGSAGHNNVNANSHNSSNSIWVQPNRPQQLQHPHQQHPQHHQHHHHQLHPQRQHHSSQHQNDGGEREPQQHRSRPVNDHSIQILNVFSSSPSPNPSSNKPYMDFFEDREGAGGMRVGRDYQAKIPALIPTEERSVQSDPDKALLVWCPCERLTDEQVEHYLAVARDKFQYSGEQALGLLFWHRYDVNRALQDLGNFTPNPEEWTIEDKVLFEQAFQFHGKAFDRIRSMLPDKSMSSLIRYYYKWKKLRCKTSVMDRQVKKFSQEDGDDQNAPPPLSHGLSHLHQHSNHQTLRSLPASSHSSSIHSSHQSSHQLQTQPQNVHSSYHLPLQPTTASGHANANALSNANAHANASDSDPDDIITAESGICENCGILGTELHSKDNKESMCKTCFLFWKKTGEMRPLTGPMRRGDRQMMGLGALRQRRTPPKGMFINHEDLTMLASSPPQAENVTLQGLEKEVHEVKCRVQTTKQGIEMLKASLALNAVPTLKPTESSVASSRITARWSQDELLMAAQGVRRYGKNFTRISEVMGTKSEVHLKAFYANYRRRYGLDSLVQEHLLELEQMNLEDMLMDNNNDASSSVSSTPSTPTSTAQPSSHLSNSNNNSSNSTLTTTVNNNCKNSTTTASSSGSVASSINGQISIPCTPQGEGSVKSDKSSIKRCIEF